MRQYLGDLQHVLLDRVALGLITVQERLRRRTLQDKRQFPGQVERVLNARIHSLSAVRRVNVR